MPVVGNNSETKDKNVLIIVKILEHIRFNKSVKCLKDALAEYNPSDIDKCLNKLILISKENRLYNWASYKLIDNINETKGSALTPLVYAVLHNHVEIVKYLLETYHPDLEVKCNAYIDGDLVKGVAALWVAVSFNFKELVILFLEHGANVDNGSMTNSTPLRVACFDGQTELVKLLLNHGANCDIGNNFNNTPLMIASYKGYLKIVKLLIENGTDLNKQALCGSTALNFASEVGNLKIVSLLILLGAELIPNNAGFTPLFTAALYNQEETVMLIMSLSKTITLEDKIITYELLGASYISQENFVNRTLIEKMYECYRKSFILRYSELDVKSTGIEPLESMVFEAEKVPPISKPNNNCPISAYRFYEECKTLEQLESIKDDTNRMIYESFMILERILGTKSLKLSDILILRGADFVDQGELDQGLDLWKHAITIKINGKVFIGKDMIRFEQALFNTYTLAHCNDYDNLGKRIEQALELAVRFYTEQPKPFGYQHLFRQISVGDLSQVEFFTVNDLKKEIFRTNIYDSNKKSLRKESDYDANIVTMAVIFVCSLLVEYYSKLPEKIRHSLRKIIYKLCKMDIVDTINGCTLLQMCMYISIQYSDMGYNFYINPLQLSNFQSMGIIDMLLSCGIDTNVADKMYNTPLHVFSCFVMTNETIPVEMLFQMFNQLVTASPTNPIPVNSKTSFSPFYAGLTTVHFDAVNVLNQTFFDTAPDTLIARTLLDDKKLLPLKCIAARSAHLQYLRCDLCRKARRIDTLQKLSLFKTISEVSSYFGEFCNCLNEHASSPSFVENPTDLLGGFRNAFEYENNYGIHDLIEFDADHVWSVMQHLSGKLKISLELLQFIEMHGPCKFIHFKL